MNTNVGTHPPPTRGYSLMLASTACFTVNVLLIRALGRIESVDIWQVSGVRFATGLVILAALYRRDVRLVRLFRNRQLASRGIVGGLGVCGYYLTIVHLGAGRATFLGNTYVIFAGLLAVALLGERFHPSLALGGTAALAGLALLTDAFAATRQPGFYEAVAILTAIASAYVVVTIRQLHATEHTATIFAAQCVYGLIVCILPLVHHPARVSAAAGSVMLAAGACVAAGQLLMTRAFRDLTVAEGTLLQMLVPVGVALGGILFFQESFAPAEVAGASLILVGTAVTARRRAPELPVSSAK